jgi:hypothetical protein
MKAKPSTLKQQLSKDMKKQGHVTKKKPNNNKISSEESLAEKPKKGNYREPNSKKLSSETSLQKSHKLVHLKEFAGFENDSEIDSEIQEMPKVKVKDLIDYLQTLDPESGVKLDKDGWDYEKTPLETIKYSGVFDYFIDGDEKILFINN